GSIKGRTAVGLLASVAPLVTDRSRLIESTSGNLGVAMAGLCRKLALPFTAVVDDRLPVRMDRRMRELGAELLAVDATRDGEDDLLASRLRLVSKVCALDD